MQKVALRAKKKRRFGSGFRVYEAQYYSDYEQGKGVLHQGSSNSLKIVDFGMVSESTGLTIMVNTG